MVMVGSKYKSSRENKIGTVTHTWRQWPNFLENGAWRLFDLGDRGRLWSRGHAFDDLADFFGVWEAHGGQLGVYDSVIHRHLERSPSTDFAGHNRMRDLPEMIGCNIGRTCSQLNLFFSRID